MAHKLPLQMPFVPAIVERLPRPPAAQPRHPTTVPPEHIAPLSEDDTRAPAKAPLVGDEDLVPPARLYPALFHWLAATRTGPLDLDRLTHQLAAGALPRYLPRRLLRRWHPDLVVLLDFSQRLWPYRSDMHRLAARLLRLCGRTGLSLRIIEHGPFGPWSDWVAHQEAAPHAQGREERPWQPPPARARMLIVSDLGLLPGAPPSAASTWLEFVTLLRRKGLQPVALAPVSTSRLPTALTRRLPVLRWSPDAAPRPARGRGGDPVPGEEEALADLLAMIAATRRVDPPLLRAMRRLNAQAPLDASLEGAVWSHPDVVAGFTVQIRAEARARHLARFAERLQRWHGELNALRRHHHAHLRAVLNHEETLLWAAHADAAAAGSCEASEQIAAARRFIKELAATLLQPGSAIQSARWWTIAQDILARADGTMATQFRDELHSLLAPVVMRQGPSAKVPGWADPALLANAVPGRDTGTAWLVYDAESGSLRLQPNAERARQCSLGQPLFIDAGGVRVSRPGSDAGRLVFAGALPVSVAAIGDLGELYLETETETLQVAAVSRPRGALGWGYTRHRLEVRSPELARRQERWTGDALRAGRRTTDGSWAFETRATRPAAKRSPEIEFGIDADYGVWARLFIATEHGSATQRFRWIEPGSFWMGSSEDEPGHLDNEGPRHLVTLTRGFWLADTPCTQAFWLAVMGDSPSRFQSPHRPVEQVSWKDVQRFLAALEQVLPGCGASMPTEAEWEYACRAGTTSAIYAGDFDILGANNAPALDPIAWYGGNSGVDFDLDSGEDSSNWDEKQYPHERPGTRAVAGKQPNAWGLYDMLGNVWEWCADGRRAYTDEAQVDPWGDAEGDAALRAIRGGSWYGGAGWVRSAFRFAFHPGLADFYLGFRLSLRSIEPG